MEAAFSDFDLKAARREVCLDQDFEQLLRKPRIAQLHRRDVYRQSQLGVPVPGIVQGLADQAFGQLGNQADLFGHRDEDFRIDHAEPRRIPPRQHLEADDRAAFKIDLLFIVRHEFAQRNAAADAGGNFGTEPLFVFHVRLKPGQSVPAVALGMVHRDVGHVKLRLNVDRLAQRRAADAGRN